MSDVIYTVSWDAVAGSNGYLIEYRNSLSATWLTPSTSANPTLFTEYDLVLEEGNTYYVRISNTNVNCIKKYVIITIDTEGESTGTFAASASFNYSIDDITGSGLPSVTLPTGVNGYSDAQYTGTIAAQTLLVDISGSNMISTKLVLYINDVVIDCVQMAGADTYSLDLPETDAPAIIIVAIDSGAC